MRHRVSHRKLGRVTEHRISMLRNQAHALLRHERIETTVPKAKELRPFVERIITIAKRGLAGGDANGRALHARRLVLRDIQDRDVVSKLFDTIAPRFEARPGGYTRILRARLPPRRQRGSRADRAGRQRVQSERRDREGRRGREGRSRRASADACAPPPSGCAARRRKRAPKKAPRAEKSAKPARPKREKTGRADTRGKGAEDHHAAQGRRQLADRRAGRPRHRATTARTLRNPAVQPARFFY